MSNPECFSLYIGEFTCQQCKLAQRCRSVFLTAGVEIAAGALTMMIAKLPDIKYQDTDRIPLILEQIMNPKAPTPTVMTQVQMEMLAAIEGKK